MKLTPTEISTRQLRYEPGSFLFTAEDSELPRASRLYDDACDTGYTLVSHKTGSRRIVSLAHTEKDRDGDVSYWDYKTDSSPRITLRVYND
jgi:hypothetical protein